MEYKRQLAPTVPLIKLSESRASSGDELGYIQAVVQSDPSHHATSSHALPHMCQFPPPSPPLLLSSPPFSSLLFSSLIVSTTPISHWSSISAWQVWIWWQVGRKEGRKVRLCTITSSTISNSTGQEIEVSWVHTCCVVLTVTDSYRYVEYAAGTQSSTM